VRDSLPRLAQADVELAGAATQTYPTLQAGRSRTFTMPKTREAASKGWSVSASDAPGTDESDEQTHVVAVLEGTNGKVMLVDRCIEQ
jgi:hypothetical protein